MYFCMIFFQKFVHIFFWEYFQKIFYRRFLRELFFSENSTKGFPKRFSRHFSRECLSSIFSRISLGFFSHTLPIQSKMLPKISMRILRKISFETPPGILSKIPAGISYEITSRRYFHLHRFLQKVRNFFWDFIKIFLQKYIYGLLQKYFKQFLYKSNMSCFGNYSQGFSKFFLRNSIWGSCRNSYLE